MESLLVSWIMSLFACSLNAVRQIVISTYLRQDSR